MGRALRSVVGGCAGALALGAGVAVAVSSSSGGGPPGSSYVVEVSCPSEPQVYVRDLDAGPPPATLVPAVGTEATPGTWTYELRAGDRDQSVASRCGDESETARYDVDLPALLPGPTVVGFGDWRPEMSGTTVVGTDCPAGSEATVSFRGAGGDEESAIAPIDEFGDWEVPVPVAAPAGDLTVNAACGGTTYEPLVLARGAGPPGAPPAAPAEAIGAAPTFTG